MKSELLRVGPAALETSSACSCTTCTLRGLAGFYSLVLTLRASLRLLLPLVVAPCMTLAPERRLLGWREICIEALSAGFLSPAAGEA
jgi:hypothetical protein